MADLRNITSRGIYLDPSAGSRKEPALALTAGDRLTADIIEKLDGGFYRIRLQGRTLDARSSLVLEPGEQVRVEVGQVSPRIILTPVGRDHATVSGRAALVREALLANDKVGPLYDSLLRSLLSLSDGAASAVGKGEADRIRALLEGVVLQEGASYEKIRNALIDGGLFFESKVKSILLSARPVRGGLQQVLRDDLKGTIMGLALRLQELSQSLPPGAVKDELGQLREALAAYTRSLEAKEIINHLFSLNGRPFHFEIPLAFGEQTRTVDFYYEQLHQQSGRGEGKGKGGCRVVLLLDLPDMGRISADLVLRSGTIDCRFMTEAKALAEMIAANLSRLSAALEAAGFTVGSLRADWGRKEAVVRVEMEEEKFLDALRLIDLRV